MPVIKTNIQMTWISFQVKEKENSDLYVDNPNDSVPNVADHFPKGQMLGANAANMNGEK